VSSGALDFDTTLVSAWKSIINNYSSPVSIAVQLKRNSQVISYNSSWHQWPMASTIKVSVLSGLLHNTDGNLNSYQQDLATRMIRYSDNNATTTLINDYLGGTLNLSQIFSANGMSQTHPASWWGLTTTVASDQLKLLNEIYLTSSNGYLNQRSRDYIADLMSTVTPIQRWGISAGSSNYYIKDGWRTLNGWDWCANSIGYIPRNGNNGYTIAVYTDNNGPLQHGIDILEQLARVTAQIIPW
jgi:hypothetical protein